MSIVASISCDMCMYKVCISYAQKNEYSSYIFLLTVDTFCDDETDAKLKMRKYCEELPRPFFALYNTQTETVHIDRPVRRAVGVPTPSS